MSTTQETADTETGVETITEDTLVPLRIGGSGSGFVIGNDEESLTARSTYTKYLVYATANSVLRCEAVNTTDRGLLSTVMESGLEFETYTEEANNKFGRPAVQIVVDEGEEAYDELSEEFDDNAYLHAAIKDVTVYEAAQELETTPILPLVDEDDDIVNTIGGGWSDPDLISGAIEHEGEILEQDLREFTPDLDFVLDNWSALGGSRRGIVNHARHEDGTVENLLEMCRDPVDDVEQMLMKRNDNDYTAHGIREVEEAIVADEEDRFRSFCGMVTLKRSRATVLELEIDSISDRLICSLCAKSMDYDF